mgnify:CR=1 FL=1
MSLKDVMRSVLLGFLAAAILVAPGCSRSEWLEEKANRAEYEGRSEDAKRLREEANQARVEEEKYSAWKKQNGRTSSQYDPLSVARSIEERANRAEYEGRLEEAKRLQQEAKRSQEDNDKYQTWKRDNGRASGSQRSPRAMRLEEEANRAEYEGRHQDATRLRQDARRVQEDDDKYQAWKKANNK